MIKCYCDNNTGLIRVFCRDDMDRPYDPTTETMFLMDRPPEPHDKIDVTTGKFISKSQAEIDAETAAQEEEITRAKFTEREDTSLLLFFELTNMVRVLEGKAKITKQQFWNAVKNKHKTQQFFDF